MSRKSSEDQYGTVAVTIHWVTAFLILVLLGTGFLSDETESSAAKVVFLRIHVPAGLTVLVLTIARICWWLVADKKPVRVPMPAWQDRTSQAVHVLLYVVVLGMGITGIGIMVLSGAGSIIFAGENAPLPDFWDILPRTPHGIGALILVVLLLLHAGAALYHHFVARDGLLRRMWFSTQ